MSVATGLPRSPADRAGLLLLSRDVTFLERVSAASGTGDLYAELVPGKERHAVLAAARRLGLSAVATNAVVMSHPEDWSRHRLVRAIHLNTTLSEVEEAQGDRHAPASERPSARAPVRPCALSPRDAWLRPAADLTRTEVLVWGAVSGVLTLGAEQAKPGTRRYVNADYEEPV